MTRVNYIIAVGIGIAVRIGIGIVIVMESDSESKSESNRNRNRNRKLGSGGFLFLTIALFWFTLDRNLLALPIPTLTTLVWTSLNKATFFLWNHSHYRCTHTWRCLFTLFASKCSDACAAKVTYSLNTCTTICTRAWTTKVCRQETGRKKDMYEHYFLISAYSWNMCRYVNLNCIYGMLTWSSM